MGRSKYIKEARRRIDAEPFCAYTSEPPVSEEFLDVWGPTRSDT